MRRNYDAPTGGGQNQTALNKSSEAIRLKPNFAAAYRFRADRYDALGKKAEAKRDWAKAEELEKSSPSSLASP